MLVDAIDVVDAFWYERNKRLAFSCKGPVTQRKRMNHARITHRFSFLRGACVVCVIRRWNERGPSVIVSVCASKAVCAFFEF